MKISMAGIDHAKAALSIREKFSFTTSQRQRIVQYIKKTYQPTGCVLLSTCNRTELWLSGTTADAQQILCEAAKLDGKVYEQFFSSRTDKEAVEHLFQLAAGLQSMVFGEDQILTQVRCAAKEARELGCTDAVLEKLFLSAVSAAKKIKSTVKFSHADRSVAESAVNALDSLYADKQHTKCLVIGNGEMGQLTAQLLEQRGYPVCMTVRMYRKGEVVIPAGCSAVMYEDRADRIKQSDVVVSATISPHYTVEEITYPKDGRQRTLIDLAVPRDIEYSLKHCPGVQLYDVDDLGSDPKNNQQEVAKAQQIIDEYIDKFYQWHYFRGFAPDIEEISTITAMDTAARASHALHEAEGIVMDEQEWIDAVQEASKNAVSSLIYGLKGDVDKHTIAACIQGLRKAARIQEEGIR